MITPAEIIASLKPENQHIELIKIPVRGPIYIFVSTKQGTYSHIELRSDRSLRFNPDDVTVIPTNAFEDMLDGKKEPGVRCVRINPGSVLQLVPKNTRIFNYGGTNINYASVNYPIV